MVVDAGAGRRRARVGRGVILIMDAVDGLTF
jgi:hypothetical protein